MSGVLVLRPTGFSTPGGWVASAGTALACISDASDATYITDTSGVGFGAAHFYATFAGAGSLPAKSTITSITPKVRASASGAGELEGQAYVPPQSGSPYATPTKGKYIPSVAIATVAWPAGGSYASGSLTPQQVIDQITLAIDNGTPSPQTDRVYEVWLEVFYDEAPVTGSVTVDSVLSATQTPKPQIDWGYSDAEGDPQVAAQIVTYPTSVVTALSITDPWVTGTPPAGYVDLGAVTGSVGGYQLVNALTNGTQYTSFVRVADLPGGASSPRYGPGTGNVVYTINVTQPITPVAGDLTLVYDPTRQRVQVNAKAHLNLLPPDAANMEGSIGNWGATNKTNCNVVQSGTQFLSGASSMRVTAVSTGGWTVDLGAASAGTAIPVANSTAYVAVASFRAAATSRNVSVNIKWYNGTTLLSTSSGGTASDGTGGWTQATVSATSPATANFAVVQVQAAASAASEIQFVDNVGLTPGTSTLWTQGVGGVGTIYLERSYDGGTTWFSVLSVSGQAFSTTTGLLGPFYDVVLSPNRSTVWRMSVSEMVTLSGVTFPVISLTGPNSSPIVTTFTSFVLRDPTDVESEVFLPLTGDLSSSATEPQGSFKPLGASRLVFVTDTSTGETFNATVVFRTEADFQKFESLRTRAAVTMLLQTDMTGVMYWVSIGSDRKQTLYRRFGRIAATTRAREVTVDLTEVAIPVGQPTAA